MHNILVLGGGFGGVSAARQLERLLGARDVATYLDRSSRGHSGAPP
jgi:NADH dehydrogenase FAD-containing subunit